MGFVDAAKAASIGKSAAQAVLLASDRTPYKIFKHTFLNLSDCVSLTL